FEAPPRYVISNSPAAVGVQGPDRTIAKFDMGNKANGQEIGAYLQAWTKGVRLGAMERFTVNGMKAATAPATIGDYNARLVAIEFAPERVARFILGTLPQTGERYTGDLQKLVMSFRKISAAEAAKVKPLRIRVVTARQGDTVASLAKRMVFTEHQVDRFRVLHGLKADR